MIVLAAEVSTSPNGLKAEKNAQTLQKLILYDSQKADLQLG